MSEESFSVRCLNCRHFFTVTGKDKEDYLCGGSTCSNGMGRYECSRCDDKDSSFNCRNLVSVCESCRAEFTQNGK